MRSQQSPILNAGMHYKNRVEAGEKLAAALAKYAGRSDIIVYALPRGGVPVAVEVAKRIHAPLDLVIVRKIGHPEEPEYAVCAVTESGHLLCSEEERALLDPAWLAAAVAEGEREARRRREAYLGGSGRLSCRDKTAIIVDDGIATGLTMLAAIDELSREGPKEVVVAVPVTPEEAAQKVKAKRATLVALQIPELYEGAVGAYYEEFPQVEDAEVTALLKEHGTI